LKRELKGLIDCLRLWGRSLRRKYVRCIPRIPGRLNGRILA
jgi:hypothetical protein